MIVYIDQSGFFHPNDNNDFFVTAAIAFQEDVLRQLARSLYNLNEIYWKATDPYEFEIKGHLLLNPRAIKHPKNTEYAKEALILCKQHGGIAFGIIEQRPTQEGFDNINQLFLPRSYKFLFERIDRCCLTVGGAEKAIMIFDAQDMRKNEILSKKVSNFLYRAKAGSMLANIIPEPYFVSSNICYGIQLADLVAYIISQKFSRRAEVVQFYDQIKEFEFHCHEDESEYPMHGIKLIKDQPAIDREEDAAGDRTGDKT